MSVGFGKAPSFVFLPEIQCLSAETLILFLSEGPPPHGVLHLGLSLQIHCNHGGAGGRACGVAKWMQHDGEVIGD